MCLGKGCLVSFEQSLAFWLPLCVHLASAASPCEPLASRARPSMRAAQTAIATPSQEVLLAGSIGSFRRHSGHHDPPQASSGPTRVKGKQASRLATKPAAWRRHTGDIMSTNTLTASFYTRGSPSQMLLQPSGPSPNSLCAG